MLEEAYLRVGFREIKTCVVLLPLRLPSAAECMRFERKSFSALRQMPTGRSEAEQADT